MKYPVMPMDPGIYEVWSSSMSIMNIEEDIVSVLKNSDDSPWISGRLYGVKSTLTVASPVKDDGEGLSMRLCVFCVLATVPSSFPISSFPCWSESLSYKAIRSESGSAHFALFFLGH